MGILWNEISTKSNGGTELMCRRIEKDLPQELLDDVQIVPSRLYGELDPTKVRILLLEDLAGDPESDKILMNQGWRKFHAIVCVSHFQMQQYMARYDIPWSKFIVIPNSIEPIERELPWKIEDKVKFIYHTTPHRGLQILYPVFDQISKKYPNVQLDVYSSFDIYGWGERNAPFQELFDAIKDHPNMNYFGSRPNEEVREALANSHVFVYPSIWTETSCMCLMEAMSAGLYCIHSNLGALYETAANWTAMYQFNEDQNKHAGALYGILDGFLAGLNDEKQIDMISTQVRNQKGYADIFYNWNTRKYQWIDLIQKLQKLPREFEKAMLTIRT